MMRTTNGASLVVATLHAELMKHPERTVYRDTRTNNGNRGLIAVMLLVAGYSTSNNQTTGDFSFEKNGRRYTKADAFEVLASHYLPEGDQTERTALASMIVGDGRLVDYRQLAQELEDLTGYRPRVSAYGHENWEPWKIAVAVVLILLVIAISMIFGG